MPVYAPTTLFYTSDALISVGEMQSTLHTLLASNVNAQSLGSKAEESYGLGGALGEVDDLINVPKSFYYATWLSTGSGIASDLRKDNPYYPLYINLNLEYTENGLTLQSLQATNYAPEVALSVLNIHIANGNSQSNITGTADYASKYGNVTVPLNIRLSDETATQIDIEVGAYWGFPKYRIFSIYLPKGYVPSSGCSVAPYQSGGIW
jgi:hypothetical protein